MCAIFRGENGGVYSLSPAGLLRRLTCSTSRGRGVSRGQLVPVEAPAKPTFDPAASPRQQFPVNRESAAVTALSTGH